MIKRYRLVGLLAGALLLGAALLGRPQVTLAGDVTAAPRTVDVTGRGTVSMKYDSALVTLGVSAMKDSPGAAYDAMAASINSVVAALQAEGVKADDMKTGVLSLNAEYDWVQNEGQRLRGYRATNTITVTTQQLDKVARLAQVAVASGANQLQGVSFAVTDMDAVIDQATDMAVDDAKARAERVAKRLGTSVQGVMRITVGDAGGPPRPPIAYAADAKAGSAPAPVFSGAAEMAITVNVTFELK
jgi:uncharacterized protein YggE